VEDQQFALTWTVSDDAVKVEMEMWPGIWIEISGGSENLNLATGSHTIRLRAIDEVGNIGYAEVTFVVGAEAPTMEIVYPSNGTVVDVRGFPVQWWCAPADLIELRYSQAGGADWSEWIDVTDLIDADGRGSYFITLPDGEDFRIELRVTNGEEVQTFWSEFDVDVFELDVEITSPTEGQSFNEGEPVNLAWDPSNDVAKIEMSFDGSNWVDVRMALGFTVTPAAGDHTLYLRASDVTGTQTVYERVNFTVVPPLSVTITSPGQGNTSGTTVVVEFDSTGAVDKAFISVDGGAFYEIENGYALSNLTEGQHTIVVKVVDAEGNPEDSAPVTFTVDGTGPMLEITTKPAANTNNANVTIAWSASDDAVKTELIQDGEVHNVTGQTSVTLPLSEGQHEISIIVYDEYGNPTKETFTVNVDVTAPTLDINAPSEGQTVNSGTVNVEWTANEDVTAWISVDGGAFVEVDGSSYAATALVNGAHTIVVKVQDAAGNTVERTVNFTVDAPAPTVAITSPANGVTKNTKDVAVAWTIDGSAEAVWVTLDNGAEKLADSLTGHLLQGLSEGQHTVKVRVKDINGNEATATVTFFVDTTAPTLTITGPNNGEAGYVSTDGSITVTWKAGNDTTGVKIKLDNGDWIVIEDSKQESYTFSNIGNGTHSVTVHVYDANGNPVEKTFEFTVGEESSSSGGLLNGAGGWVIWLAALVIVALLVLGLLMLRKKKAD